ncbi:hypothetical protein ACGFIV_18865 [Sphaerisporangium sp. NPDC049003]
MALRDTVKSLAGQEDGAAERNVGEAEDAFDAPMMIMNQIHEA